MRTKVYTPKIWLLPVALFAFVGACAPAKSTISEPSAAPQPAAVSKLDFDAEIRLMTDACFAAMERGNGIANLSANGYSRTGANTYEKIGNDPGLAEVLTGQRKISVDVVYEIRRNSCEVDARNIWATTDENPRIVERRILNASMQAARNRGYEPVTVAGVLGGDREALTNGRTTVTVNSSVGARNGTRVLSIRFREYDRS